MTYEELIDEASCENIIVKEAPLKNNDGRCFGNKIAIRKDIPTLKKGCVLAEELGHYYTSAGNILDMDNVLNRKQEYRARLWAYDKRIGLMGIINAFKAGHDSLYSIADFLDVTEEFLKEALECYKNKYGVCVSVDRYMIQFVPNLKVFEYIPIHFAKKV